MNTWPSELEYAQNQNYNSEPPVLQTESVNNSRRQRLKHKDRDDVFNVKLDVNNAQLATFKAFVKANPDKFIGPYFDSDYEQSATLRIIDSKYEYTLTSNNFWEVTFRLEVIDRNHEIGEDIFDLAVSMGAAFTDMGELSMALAIAVNEGGA
jgi:hypothetical protein